VIRFSNAQVLTETDGVLAHILACACGPSPSQAFGLGPALSRRERGI
jgi:hypothetical protein